ncbi:MAG: hypothetical protein MJ066_04355 [Clostridia bacterium]|nr:hypothetical protein [Clostridia bacterium]
MEKCSNCHGEMKNGYKLSCPNCGALICSSCAEKSFKICPYCYSDLDYFG